MTCKLSDAHSDTRGKNNISKKRKENVTETFNLCKISNEKIITAWEINILYGLHLNAKCSVGSQVQETNHTFTSA